MIKADGYNVQIWYLGGNQTITCPTREAVIREIIKIVEDDIVTEFNVRAVNNRVSVSPDRNEPEGYDANRKSFSSNRYD